VKCPGQKSAVTDALSKPFSESLIYLIIGLYPNIELAIVKLAQLMANPSNEHYQAGLHFCRYFLNTCKYQIVYNRFSNEFVVAYFNLDWAQDSESYKSITGYFTLMAYGITFWISHQQKTIVLSSIETEYMGLSDCGH